MRIGVILSGLGAGGAERVVALLAREWTRRGWDVVLICFEKADGTSYHWLPDEVRIVRRPPAAARSPARAALDMLGRIAFLRRTIAREKPDLLISFLTKINVLALLANWGSSVPLVICERNNPERQQVWPGWRRLQDRLAHRAMLILQTQASRRAFHHVVPGRVRVIPNPVELPPAEVDHEARTIVAVGRLVEQKGFDLLICSFARIAAEYPDWKLVIWGEGPLRGALERSRDEKGLRDRVMLPGISREPGSWMRSGSIFVLSSRYEGFPNVLLEAMSSGMPVVAFDCPFGPAEIVRHGEDGYLVRPENADALAAALGSLMGDEPSRRRMGLAARKNVERFGLEKVLEQWDEALAAALPHRSAEDWSRAAVAKALQDGMGAGS
jgi:glycosyltransferase involved in cell wall biosynthesis